MTKLRTTILTTLTAASVACGAHDAADPRGDEASAATACANAPAWVAMHAYTTGDVVTYGGATYRCVQGHTSQGGWEPTNAAALWQPVDCAPIAPPPKATDAGAPPAQAGTCASIFGSGLAQSKWARIGPGGALTYATTSKGDRIADFSFAGYGGGGVVIPTVAQAARVAPSGGDDTAAIQAALDHVSSLALTNGARGAVVLAPGTFHVSKGLRVGASGVVLRGSGVGSTTIDVSGTGFTVIDVAGHGSRAVDASSKATITDAYVPSGTASFHVDTPSRFAVGDDIVVTRPVTAAWVHFMGMDTLVRNGKPQTWLAAGSAKTFERRVTAIAGDRVTVDIPLTDSLDAQYVRPPGATVAKYTYSGRITEVGVEDLTVVAPVRSATSSLDMIAFSDVVDAWVRNVAGRNFTGGVSVVASKRVTVEDVALTHDATTYFTAAAPADFSVNASQVLVQRSSSTGGLKIWYGVTHTEQGPNAFVDFTASGAHSHFAPHQRWSTGLLVDSSDIDGGISFGNVGTAGSGHGWTMGWGVVWNSHSSVSVQSPPGATNWAIGCTGSASPGSPPGTYDSQGANVAPKSLYLAQLCDRLGPQAVRNIGYAVP